MTTTVHRISLCLVRMCLKASKHPHMLHSAQSSRYAPALDWNGKFIHGNYVVLSTSNKWN